MSLTPEQRDEAARALTGNGTGAGCVWTLAEAEPILDDLAPVIANWLAAEREAGAAEVIARVEAAIDKHAAEFYTPSLRVEAVHVTAIRAALHPTTEEPS